jgi:hypothetical protein
MEDFGWWQKNEQDTGQMAQELDPLYIELLMEIHHHEIKLLHSIFRQEIVIELSLNMAYLIGELNEILASCILDSFIIELAFQGLDLEEALDELPFFVIGNTNSHHLFQLCFAAALEIKLVLMSLGNCVLATLVRRQIVEAGDQLFKIDEALVAAAHRMLLLHGGPDLFKVAYYEGCFSIGLILLLVDDGGCQVLLL